jgi:hypothetical protein
MVQLKGEVSYVWPRDGFWTSYRNKIPNIGHAAAPILCDLHGSKGVEFDKLVNTLCGFTDNEVNVETGRQRILEAIKAITQFFDA